MDFIEKKGRPTGSNTNNVTTTTSAPETVLNLSATDVTTGKVNTTASISSEGFLVQSIALSDISFWYIDGSMLYLYSTDALPIHLGFVNSTEANLASTRLQNIINGGVV